MVCKPTKQWKDVKDNHVKVVSKQDDVQPKTRKKLVPVHKGLAKKVQT